MDPSIQAKPRYIVSGMPEPRSKEYLDKLYSSAPLKMLPPVVYFSSPEESVFSAGGPWSEPIEGQDFTPQPIRVEVVLYSFKNLFNPILSRTEMCAALLLADSTPLDKFRSEILGISYKVPFVAYFLIAVDPVRSSASRSFCISVANALSKRPMSFDLIPTSLPAIVGNYNPETAKEFPATP